MWGGKGFIWDMRLAVSYSLRHEIPFSYILRFWDQAILWDMRLPFSYSLRHEILISYFLRVEIAKFYSLRFEIGCFLFFEPWDMILLFIEILRSGNSLRYEIGIFLFFEMWDWHFLILWEMRLQNFLFWDLRSANP